MRATRVALDLDALRHNLSVARAAAPGRKVLAAIKANGYGHGLVRVAQALGRADGFGVACVEEARILRQAGIDQRIFLLEGYFQPEELAEASALDLDCVIHHPAQLDALEADGWEHPIRIWVKLDSGMHRLGLEPEQLPEAVARVEALAGKVELAGCMTHLACADDLAQPGPTLAQLALFQTHTEGLPGERTIANSAGVLGWPASHADWVRPGVMLYGSSPFLGGRGPADHDPRPVMTFRSELIAVKRVAAGEAIGYGATYRCPETMLVGVVAVGYGDGYPRHAPSGTPVLVNGRRVPLVGRVSMDMITVDLRSQPDARIGNPAVLWGEGLPVEEVADKAGTISYELLCGITGRVRVVELGAEVDG